MVILLTNWFGRWHVRSNEVQPEVKLSQSLLWRVVHVHNHQMNTVTLADKVIVCRVVRLVPGKLPETHISRTFNKLSRRPYYHPRCWTAFHHLYAQQPTWTCLRLDSRHTFREIMSLTSKVYFFRCTHVVTCVILWCLRNCLLFCSNGLT